MVNINGVIANADELFVPSLPSPVAPNIDDTDCDTFRAMDDVFCPILLHFRTKTLHHDFDHHFTGNDVIHTKKRLVSVFVPEKFVF